ncbi:hypothetical protein ElyMa_002824100 [Elysia marginata]|uniref:Uncharacterized protein n=1 Tax=Elysia marginata TaxID=1093978 RepID=A0AAV4HT12_9GAST|nr:hypothetical protein ElyMa_002824100 [Elysia marginata]
MKPEIKFQDLFKDMISSFDSDEDEKEFTELTPVCTPTTKGITSDSHDFQSLGNEITNPAQSSSISEMVMSVLEEVADLIPHPLSPLPESPPPIMSSPSSDVEVDAVIDALPPPPSPAVESTQPEVVSDKLNQKAKHPILSACACKDKCFTKID